MGEEVEVKSDVEAESSGSNGETKLTRRPPFLMRLVMWPDDSASAQVSVT